MENLIQEDEVWKTIDDVMEIYEVSNLGRVRRSPNAKPAINTFPGKILKEDASTGYARVSIRLNGKVVKLLVHRLVALAFLGECRPYAHINHKDGNKRNNHISNLEWCSPQENVDHAWRTGLCSPLQGERSGNSKLKDRDIEVIFSARARGVKLSVIAEVFGVTEVSISNVANGKTWNHLSANPK